MSEWLPNYLKTYRKDFGLTQSELADLITCKSRSMISGYETGYRYPDLYETMSYEVVFGVLLKDLYPGAYEDVRTETLNRLRHLIEAKERDPINPETARTVELLKMRLVAEERIASQE